MPFSGNCTPDRSKLIGSHGQRPWIYNVLRGMYPQSRRVRETHHLLASQQIGAFHAPYETAD